MDSKSTDAREYMAQRAEFLGAIRLPKNAFLSNAGTEVVTDILFLQKREQPITDLDWRAVIALIQSIRVLGKQELDISYRYQAEYEQEVNRFSLGREVV